MKLLFFAAALATAFPASALTIVDFDTQPAPVDYTGGGSFIDSGFQFISIGGLSYVWDGASPNSNGTNNLIQGFESGWVITKVGGGSFTLISFDLALSWYTGLSSDSLTVGSAIVNFDTMLQTYIVNQTGSSITITGAPSDGYWTADNFVFAVVPEPASWVMLISGFGLIGVAARRRRAVALPA